MTKQTDIQTFAPGAEPNVVNKKVRCHGRVKDLEAKVPAQWWKTLFADALYLKTDGDVVEDPVITQEEVDVLLSHDEIKNKLGKTNVLDLCCGQGRHVLRLAQLSPDTQFYGHDQSSFLIELAQQRAKEQQLDTKATFTVGDCRTIPYATDTFSLVLLMGNSFGYFCNEEDDLAVLKEIHRVLVPGGLVVIDLPDGEWMRKNYADRSWEWIDDNTFACRERQLVRNGRRLVSREVVTDVNSGVLRDQFYQERLYSSDEMHAVLKEAGYSVAIGKDEGQVEKITAAKDLGQRNEDLGMMAHRMMIKATKMA